MKKEICKNCANFSAYYRRSCFTFTKLDMGNCVKHKEQRKCDETCEKYICNSAKEKSVQEAAIKQLTHALTSIEEVTAILKDMRLS